VKVKAAAVVGFDANGGNTILTVGDTTIIIS
jgi:hypothetical protein